MTDGNVNTVNINKRSTNIHDNNGCLSSINHSLQILYMFLNYDF